MHLPARAAPLTSPRLAPRAPLLSLPLARGLAPTTTRGAPQVPVGRSLEDFKQETAANGFPTFREEEVVDAANLQAKPVGTTGTKLLTTATCGAHRGVTQLGRYEESQNGAPRYIVDLSCVAGVGKQR